MSRPRSWLALALALVVRASIRPGLAVELMALAWAFRKRNWWTTAPFLPVPDRAYLRWRMYTAYADEAAVPPIEDVIRFAHWRRTILSR